jgi:TusA-related sulfurtransferase
MAKLPLLVDCRGLECPLPIIQVRLALNQSVKDDVLVIYADDEPFDQEFLRFCQLADVRLLSKREMGGFREYEIQVIL